ncbi:MAG: iron-containing alcohol dehydrogenase, partial [Rectinemataceae bacterium]
MRSFEAFSVPFVQFGAGTSSKAGKIISSFCKPRATILLITDQNILASGMLERIVEGIHEEGFDLEILDSIPAEPTDNDLDLLAGKVRETNPSAMIAVGGGSVIDATKVLSTLAIHQCSTMELADRGVPGRGIPCVMIPTTAGTGAEATPNAIVLFPSRNLKIGIVSRYLIPQFVILDPELTLGLPASLTASTGIDAICHLLECYIGKKANAFSDMYALEGLRLMMTSLQVAYHEGSNLEARSKAMLGAYYGGVCITASGTNAIHALSYPLGGIYRIPHGIANAILLVPVMKYQKEFIASRLAMVADAIGSGIKGDVRARANELIESLRSLVKEMGIPATLKPFGISTSALDTLADAAYGV